MYFGTKNYLKSNRYHTAKHFRKHDKNIEINQRFSYTQCMNFKQMDFSILILIREL